MGNVVSLYGGKDPRELPFYTAADASRILGVPPGTLAAWCGLKQYKLADGNQRKMAPLLRRDPSTKRMSFHTLVEGYVLSSITRTFNIRLEDLRRALGYIGGTRPLLHSVFYAEEGALYIEGLNRVLINVHPAAGQAVIRQAVAGSLARIEFDIDRRPARFSPWRHSVDEARMVDVDPYRAFGRPIVRGRSLKVETIVDLFKAGESVDTLADGYDLPVDTVHGVLRWGGVSVNDAA